MIIASEVNLVVPNCQVSDLISAGNYDFVDIIRGFSDYSLSAGEARAFLVQFEYSDTSSVWRELSEEGLRPAMYHELLIFGACHQNVTLEFCSSIPAFANPTGVEWYLRILAIRFDMRGRGLISTPYHCSVGPSDRVLAVPK